jgi:hypothetical protein
MCHCASPLVEWSGVMCKGVVGWRAQGCAWGHAHGFMFSTCELTCKQTWTSQGDMVQIRVIVSDILVSLESRH